MMQFIKEIASGGPLKKFPLDIFNWPFLVSINNLKFKLIEIELWEFFKEWRGFELSKGVNF